MSIKYYANLGNFGNIVKLPYCLTHFYNESHSLSTYHVASFRHNTQKLVPSLRKIYNISKLSELRTFGILQTLTFIQFSATFNYKIGHLKNLTNLKTVIFDYYFDQPINLLPKSITRLHFGQNFSVEKLYQLPMNIQLKKLALFSDSRDLVDFNKIPAAQTISHLAIKPVFTGYLHNLTHLILIQNNFGFLDAPKINEILRTNFGARINLPSKYFHHCVLLFEFLNHKHLYIWLMHNNWTYYQKTIWPTFKTYIKNGYFYRFEEYGTTLRVIDKMLNKIFRI